MGLRCKGNTGALTSMQNAGVSGRSKSWPSRISGPELGHKRGFSVRFPSSGVQAPVEVNAYMLCTPT
jgi:hypothetical protein